MLGVYGEEAGVGGGGVGYYSMLKLRSGSNFRTGRSKARRFLHVRDLGQRVLSPSSL